MKIYEYETMLNENKIPYMITKGNPYVADGRKKYKYSSDIVAFITENLKIQHKAEEFCYCLCLDTAGHITGCFEVSHGTVNGSLVMPREVYQKALMLGAVSIILTHNHPSGDPTPSKADLDVTKKIYKAGELLNVSLLDHIIIGDEKHVSLREYYQKIWA